MYNLSTDPYELSNLCGPDVEPDNVWYYYHERLTQLMLKMGAVPSEFDWEANTKPRRYDDEDEYDTRRPPTMNSVMRNKNKANELFLQGNYQHAAIHYAKALRDCAELVDSDPVVDEKAKDVKLSLYLNLALAYIKLDQFDDAMLPCNDALKLDTTNVKALYRRATVLYQKHKFDDAIKDLDDAGRLAPEDKAVRKLRGRVDQEIAKQKKKEKIIAQKMFG
jgi:peptidyl-prolyl isomerase D